MNSELCKLKNGSEVFVQRQTFDGSPMFEMEGNAVQIADRIHVRGHKANLSFSKNDVAEYKLETSTEKIWIYLK